MQLRIVTYSEGIRVDNVNTNQDGGKDCYLYRPTTHPMCTIAIIASLIITIDTDYNLMDTNISAKINKITY